MSFNGSGGFSIINTFVAGTTILSSAVNQNFSDIATTGLSNCLTKDGQQVWGAAQNAGNFKITNLAAGTASTDAVRLSQITNQLVPVGAVSDFAGSTAPTLWLLCGGSAVSRTTYSALFAVIGTNFGVGDGVSTFNLPDCRGRSTYGVDNMGGTAANRITVAGGNFDGTVLGGTGGLQNHTLTLAEAPTGQFTHTFTDPGHNHTTNAQVANSAALLAGGGAGAAFSPAIASVASNTTNITSTITDHAGGGAHTILNPAIMFNKIIFANA